MQLARLGAWIASVLTCLKQSGNCSAYKLKVFAINFKDHLSQTLNRLIVEVSKLVQILEPEELELPFEITGSNSEKNRNQNFLRQPKQATRGVCVSFIYRDFCSAKNEWPPGM